MMTEMMVSKLPVLMAAWAAFGLAAISPGPNMLAVMARALGSSRREATGVAGGIALGAFMWALATSWGLSFVAKQWPLIIPFTGVAGGSYLIYLGILRFKIARNHKGAIEIQGSRDEASLTGCVGQGFMVIASNPKVALFWVSISAFLTKAELATDQVLIFAAICSLMAFSIYAAAAWAFSSVAMRNHYVRSQKSIDIAFSLLFVAIGLYLIWFAIGLAS